MVIAITHGKTEKKWKNLTKGGKTIKIIQNIIVTVNVFCC
jgi:hypothetical protein